MAGHRWQSKNLTIDPNHPDAYGICDDSGLAFRHKDLVKQMEWRGNNYVWTGQLRGPQYIDAPQEQLRPPLVKEDPKPVLNPRPHLESAPIMEPPQLLEKLATEVFYDSSLNESSIDDSDVPISQILNNLNKPAWNQ